MSISCAGAVLGFNGIEYPFVKISLVLGVSVDTFSTMVSMNATQKVFIDSSIAVARD